MIRPCLSFLFVFVLGWFVLNPVEGIEPNPSAIYIQRTMKALSNSTEAQPASVRVLFYGQSIVAQEWTVQVQEELKKRYPTVKFTFKNSAIGGYTSPALIRTAESDLYPWYPDLLFFHVYGDIKKYEEIVQKTRRETSAEIILWTSHLSSNQDPTTMLKERDQRSKDILDVAKRQKCMIIDLNQKWCHLLIENQWKASELLRDTVHLTPNGCKYYARFIEEELVRIPETQGVDSVSGTIRPIALTDSAVKKNHDGSLELTFNGNRVCAISDGMGTENAKATLLLDGKPMKEFKELWATTRPSNGPVWMPAINAVSWNVPPVKEEWTLTALPESHEDGSLIYYQVKGSVTGFDGKGSSAERFVSHSGRVIIENSDFAAVGQYKYFKKTLPKDFKVTWSNYPLFADPYIAAAKDVQTVLVQNCSNERHVLTIIPEKSDWNLGIASFVIYAPAVVKTP